MRPFKCGRGKSRRRHGWSFSVPEPSHNSLGGLDAEGRLWGSRGCWVFNCGVQWVVGLQSQMWGAGLGASSLGESLVCSPPCMRGKPVVSLKKNPK